MGQTGNPPGRQSGKVTLRIGIVGGGRACKSLLKFLQFNPFSFLEVQLAGVCDINPEAEGLQFARRLGVYTTGDYRELFEVADLDTIIELTNSREVLLDLVRDKPKGVGVIDHNIGRLTSGLTTLEHLLRSVEQRIVQERQASDFLIHQTKERIVALKPDFTILEANDPYLKAVGRSKDQVIGAHCYEVTHGLQAPCSHSRPEAGCPLLETLKTGEPAHVIHECGAAESQEIYCDMVTYPVRDQNGRVVRVIEIWRDITEALAWQWQRRAEAMKEDIQKLVQEDRLISLGKLVASSVHEINNPIQGLLTFCNLMQTILQEGPPGGDDLRKFQEYLSVMSSELERCGNIVSGLLSFSRQAPMENKDLELNDIIREVLALTRHKMEIQDIRLITNLAPVPLSMHGHINQLQQCFLNLVFNSLEAMPQGGELQVKTESLEEEKGARIEIRDTGIGIPPENIDHLFDPFFTTKGEGEGTGLGLSIVHGIVKTHNGDIEVQSQVGKGSLFVLRFPATEQQHG